MLVLTEAAAEVVKSVTDTPQAPDGTGLRITQSARGTEAAGLSSPRPRNPASMTRSSRPPARGCSSTR